MTTQEWYAVNGCDHAHCPDGCEHPQPLMLEGMGDVPYCGRCAVKYGELNRMVPCTPETCADGVGPGGGAVRSHQPPGGVPR